MKKIIINLLFISSILNGMQFEQWLKEHKACQQCQHYPCNDCKTAMTEVTKNSFDNGTNIELGHDIQNHLKTCNKCLLNFWNYTSLRDLIINNN